MTTTTVRARLRNGIPVLIEPDLRFKTVTVRLVVHRPLDGGTTRAALLARMLERGCRRSPDLKAMARRLENLYGAHLEVDAGKIGERQVLVVQLQLLADRFVPRGAGHLARGLEFLTHVLAEPVKQGGRFPEEPLAQEKDNLRRRIEAVANDKAEYAAHRMIREMCRDEPYARYEWGEVEEIGGIGGRPLAAFHDRLLRRAPLEFYVAGAVRPPALLRALDRVFDLERGVPAALPPARILPAPAEPRVVVEEEPELEQGKLVLGFRTGITLADDRIYAAVVLNGIFGAFAHSRLFQAFRGDAGLAYSIHSWLERSKGLLVVEAGIEGAEFERSVETIRREARALAEAPVTDAELELTRHALDERLTGLRDNPAARLGFHLERAVNGRVETLEEAGAHMRAVGAPEVMAAAQRLQLDTVYFLRPA